MNLFVILLTVLNTVAAVWLLMWMRKRRDESQRTEDTTGHVWDGDLKEYNNPLPRWWLWLFILSVLFSIVYVVLYPALGNVKGTLGWSSTQQWEVMQAEQELQAQKILGRFAEMTPNELMVDEQALTIGRNLFANECAACHGSDGRGSTGFPNLTDADWLWGGEVDAIQTSILYGRMGVMTPWADILGTEGVDNAVAYVLTLSGRDSPIGNAQLGAESFALYCAVCHGAAGNGNPMVGGPALNDNIWLHGGSVDAIRTTIAEGRQNNMPAQGERLGELRVRLLTAYVLSLGAPRVATHSR
jgi:cytochrome c oxidase cbb3-type subunit 3